MYGLSEAPPTKRFWECAYERRPEKALTLPDELWSRNESWMRDFFEQETSDFLCLGVVSRRTNIRFVEGGGAMV